MELYLESFASMFVYIIANKKDLSVNIKEILWTYKKLSINKNPNYNALCYTAL